MAAPQNWGTPRHIFDALNADAIKRFGEGFQVDVACAPDNKLCDVGIYLTDDNPDGSLAFTWDTTFWCNPPWNDIPAFVDHAAAQLDRGVNVQGCFLLPARTDQKWFWRLSRIAEIELFKGRIAFVDPLLPAGDGRTQPREGALVAWVGPNVNVGTIDMFCRRNNLTGLLEPNE